MNITNFKFRNIDLRCVEIDGEPWFVAKDVCDALGLSNVTVALAAIPPADLSKVSRSYFDMPRGGRDMALISESGLYKLVMRSDKPEAKEFQDWVTSVVLPAIRKDGVYVKDEEKVATGEMSLEELALAAIKGLEEKIARLSAENAAMSKELNVISQDEYRALKHLKFTASISSKFSHRARAVARNMGIEPLREPRVVPNYYGNPVETNVLVFPRAVWERAYEDLKLEEPVFLMPFDKVAA